MTDIGREFVEEAHRRALEKLRSEPQPGPADMQELLQPDLPPSAPGSPFAEEWEAFRREAGRLLAEGCRGRFALVKAGQPITVWDTLRDAAQAGRLLYGDEPCLVQQILPRLRSMSAG
jgi:hypothetical protein